MLKNVILFDKATSEHALSYKDFREMGKDISDAELDEIKKTLSEYDVVNMQYTSGTTGFPKGVMLTHHNIANNAYLIANQMKLSEKDRMCIPCPVLSLLRLCPGNTYCCYTWYYYATDSYV